ncbi:hypothetical protein [Castellaniella sp.]|uniref:hypothetical protein n=1 Tax=Castellaniella sp. TaxID=1955812 RepID=UPI002B001FA7|nr:hypothetical protein [Castellaniella sp.]
MTHSLCEYIVMASIAIISALAIYVISLKLISIYKRTRSDVEPIAIKNDVAKSFQIWMTVYQQSSETLRDQAKLLASTNVAGLAAAIALSTSSSSIKYDAILLSASILTFGVGLVFSLMPIAGIVEKHGEDLTSIMKSMSDANRHTIRVPHSWPTGFRYYSGIVSLVLLGLGIFFLSLSLIKHLN